MFFSASWSFSAGVETIVSLKEFEPLPVCPKPLFGRSAVDSASGSCCGAVATTEEIWYKNHTRSTKTDSSCAESESKGCQNSPLVFTWLSARLHVFWPVCLLTGVIAVTGVPAAVEDGLLPAVGTPLLLFCLIHGLLLLHFCLLLYLRH